LTQLFFATDVHGSEVCWKKFISAGKFYGADIIILGGDMTGKAIIPIIAQGGNRYKVTLLEQTSILEGQEQVQEMVDTIQNRGYYPYVTDPDEVKEISESETRSDELFLEQVFITLERWLEYAEEKLKGTGIRAYVCPGNDDMFEIDELISSSEVVQNVEGRITALDENHEMISSGWSNPTPWDTPREEGDEALAGRIRSMTEELEDPGRAVFNLHAPPYGTGLDEAPELTEDLQLAYAGRSLIPVGSKAVLEAIEKYRPLLGLHGHIHESKGTRKVGRTLCINPGSMYEQGILQGALVELKEDKVGNYILTTG
jgi:Icc-related predicted phosphoesterase